MDNIFESMIDQLLTDEGSRSRAPRVHRRPEPDLVDWDAPLTDAEILEWMAADPQGLERVAEELTCRLLRITH